MCANKYVSKIAHATQEQPKQDGWVYSPSYDRLIYGVGLMTRKQASIGIMILSSGRSEGLLRCLQDEARVDWDRLASPRFFHSSRSISSLVIRH